MTNLTGFGLSAAINGAVAAVILLIFLIARKRPANRFVYAPRTLLPQFRQGRPAPPPLPSSWLSWLGVVFSIPRDQFVAYAGLDAYMFCRFCMLCVELFAAMTIPGVGILVPVNFTGEGGLDGFEAISMSNIPSNSSRLAAHVIVAYVFAAWTYWQLWRCWGEYCELRLAYMAQEHLHNRSLTLLVRNIPSRSRTDTAFLATFRSFFPQPASQAYGAVSPHSARSASDIHPGHDSVEPHFIHSAYVAKDIGDMADHIDERDEALAGMEKAVAAFRDKPDERPTTATKLLLFKKRDALEYYEEQMLKGDALLAEDRHRARTAECWPNGFMTFDSVMAYQSALRVDATSVPFEWECAPAPELRDVYWPAMSFTATQRLTGNVLAQCLLWALVAFWLIPVAFIQSLANLSTLPEKVHFLSFINDIPASVLGIVDGYLPPLVLTVFNILLPKILLYFTKLQGVESASRQQCGVLKKFSVFWILNYLVFSTVATSIFNQLQGLLDDPSQIVSLLGQSIPSTSTFFITFLLFQTFSSYPMQLLNPGRLVLGWIKKRFLVKVPRSVVEIEAAPSQNYGTAYPTLIFAFIIAVTFSALAPIVLPFAALYFLSAFLCFKYQYIYCYNTAFETGGLFWPVVHWCLMWCIGIAQVVFTVLLALKKSPAAAIISAPLIVAPVAWHYFVNRAYQRRTQLLPLDIAVHIDSNLEQRRQMRRQQPNDPQLRARSLTFLDEASNVQNFGYDAAEMRAMRQDDILKPHNTPSQRRTERYHAATIREQRAVIDGRKPAQLGAADGSGKGAATTDDSVLGDGDLDLDSVLAVDNEDDDASGGGAYVASRPLPLQSSGRSSASGSTDGSQTGTGAGTGMLEYRSEHALLDRVLQSATQLGPLLPPQDYIQPALLVPSQLPVPRSMPPVNRHDSLADKPQLYDEVTEAGLLRHAGGKPKRANRKQAAAANGPDRQPRPGSDDDSSDGTESAAHSLLQQPQTQTDTAQTPQRAPQQQPQHDHYRESEDQPAAESTLQRRSISADDPDEIVVHR